MRFRFFVLGLIIFVVVILSMVLYRRVYKVGYFFTGNLHTKDVVLDSRQLVSLLKRYLTDDKDRIIWWRLKFSNKIERSDLEYWRPTSSGNVIAGCAKNKFVLGGLVNRIDFFINPSLWSEEEQKNLNIVFVKCSMLSYGNDYQNNIINEFVDIFNQEQFILKKR